jgi:hypothetical protein
MNSNTPSAPALAEQPTITVQEVEQARLTFSKRERDGALGAQKSTSTGTMASRVISANAVASPSMGSETGGKVALQEPQRPVSDRCFAGTRLLAPQVGQGLIMCAL